MQSMCRSPASNRGSVSSPSLGWADEITVSAPRPRGADTVISSAQNRDSPTTLTIPVEIVLTVTIEARAAHPCSELWSCFALAIESYKLLVCYTIDQKAGNDAELCHRGKNRIFSLE